jgi:hypothetical protein
MDRELWIIKENRNVPGKVAVGEGSAPVVLIYIGQQVDFTVDKIETTQNFKTRRHRVPNVEDLSPWNRPSFISTSHAHGLNDKSRFTHRKVNPAY